MDDVRVSCGTFVCGLRKIDEHRGSECARSSRREFECDELGNFAAGWNGSAGTDGQQWIGAGATASTGAGAASGTSQATGCGERKNDSSDSDDRGELVFE